MAKPKTSGQLVKQLQPVFNLYIRLRDGKKPCIACGNYAPDKDAGHFYPVGGYSGLRFDEDNVHGECKRCNRFDDAHLIGYAENLKVKIGEADYASLKERARQYKQNGYKFGRGELRDLIEVYKLKIKMIQDDDL